MKTVRYRFLISLFFSVLLVLFIGQVWEVDGKPTQANLVARYSSSEYKTEGDELPFLEQCLSSAQLSPDVRYTIDILLEEAETDDCYQASHWLERAEVLNLPGRGIIDLTPLSGLRNLKELYLTGSDIRDISPLSSLTELRVLALNNTVRSNNEISDFSALSNLSKLESLNLAHN